MNRKALLCAAAIGTCVSCSAFAFVEDPFVLRARWLVVDPSDSSSDISVIGGTASVNANIAPEIDISYFFTDNIAAELITATTRHQVRANGTALGNLNLGSASLLPPTLTLQWHFLPDYIFAPYVGAGVNYTYFFGVDTGPVAQWIDYENSFGAVVQAGINFNLCNCWHINLDVKKVWINTDVTIYTNSSSVTELTTSVDINPWIYGIGIGYRFG